MPFSIDGEEFPTVPTDFSWDYTIKMSATKTMGGKVIQIYGVRMGDLNINGSFATPKEQSHIFKTLKGIADNQMVHFGEISYPVRLLWTERNWDFNVFIKSFNQAGASTSILARNDIARIDYSLTVFIEQDNSNIVSVAQDVAAASYIRRISNGLGWQQTDWNGAITNPDFQTALQDRTLLQYLFNQQQAVFTSMYNAPKPQTNG